MRDIPRPSSYSSGAVSAAMTVQPVKAKPAGRDSVSYRAINMCANTSVSFREGSMPRSGVRMGGDKTYRDPRRGVQESR